MRSQGTRDKGQGTRSKARREQRSRLVSFPLSLLLVTCALCLAIFGSKTATAKKKLNERVTLRRVDKLPYGTYVAKENLNYVFPNAYVDINKLSPSSYKSFTGSFSYYSTESSERRSPALYIVLSPYFFPNEKEYDALIDFANKGNHIFISAFSWGEEFEDPMKLKVTQYYMEEDSLRLAVYNPIDKDSLKFTYPGASVYGFFSSYDTSRAEVLGRDVQGRANFIRYSYDNGGSIVMHAVPIALSNFFLLHKNNNEYYNNVFSYLPMSVNHIEWDDYFRYGNRNFSSFQVIMGNDGLRWAFWLVLFIFLLIYLFESKRKQRIIPVVQPLRNSSLDFVKTIGRLYYQYRDNKNLGVKMTAHLMDHIRNRYNIPTSVMDEKFITVLAYKSGYEKEKLQKLMYQAKMMQDMPRVSERELMEFHKQTEDFYKHQ
ncbi:MAG: DUF4350 domain-containing protein [Chitinophagaceae bacterium]